MMGSGPRFDVGQSFDSFALGFQVGKFPHAVSVYLNFGFWHVYIGFGKGYDE